MTDVTPPAPEVPLLTAPNFLTQDLCTRLRTAMDCGDSDVAEVIGAAIA